MPPWIIHDKWALRLGINRRISREINLLIDFPEEWFKQKYSEDLKTWEVYYKYHYNKVLKFFNTFIQRFCRYRGALVELTDPDEPCRGLFIISKIVKKFGHDMGRGKKWQRDFQLACIYKHYGIQGVKVAILHHILDYIEENLARFDEEEILKRVNEKFGDLIYYADYSYSKEWMHAVSKAASEVLEFVKRNVTHIINDLTMKSQC